MSIVFCGIVPHPPIMVPEVGREESDKVEATQDALLELGRRISASGAETLVIISPHGPVFGDAIGLNVEERAAGDLARFGAPQVYMDEPADLELAAEIKSRGKDFRLLIVEINDRLARNFRGRVSTEMDHGVVAPMYWIKRSGWRGRFLAVSMGLLPHHQLYSFGIAVRRAAEALGRKVALVASGDLSHRLTVDAPAGFSPRGKVFDAEIVRIFRENDLQAIFELSDDLCEEAGECGLRPIIMMLGALDGYQVHSEVLSYEGPFGVGYMVASLAPGKKDDQRAILANLLKVREEKVKARRANESYLVRIARQRLENWVRGIDKLPDLGEVPPEFRRRAGVFVSIKKDGALRGCIGTVKPTTPSIVEEVMENAVSAGIRDPRFYPVRADELDELEYSVDVLSEPEKVNSLDDLDPKRYGVIVRARGRSGLLLPDLEGIDTPEEQVRIAKEKAGLSPDDEVALERFTVTRYK